MLNRNRKLTLAATLIFLTPVVLYFKSIGAFEKSVKQTTLEKRISRECDSKEFSFEVETQAQKLNAKTKKIEDQILIMKLNDQLTAESIESAITVTNNSTHFAKLVLSVSNINKGLPQMVHNFKIKPSEKIKIGTLRDLGLEELHDSMVSFSIVSDHKICERKVSYEGKE